MQSPGRERSSSLGSSALDLGDCIGVESCLDLRTDLAELEAEILSASQSKSRRDKGLGMMKGGKIKKEYPPPIPWLARTENLHSHMPWVMKRHHTSDGRLIIREERVKRHEYFQAHRSDGRLTLRLVPLSEDVSYDNHDNDDEEEEESDNVHADEDREVDGFADVAAKVITENQTGKEEESIQNLSECCMEKSGGSGGGVGGECYKSVRRTSCMFRMILPAFKPVHT